MIEAIKPKKAVFHMKILECESGAETLSYDNAIVRLYIRRVLDVGTDKDVESDIIATMHEKLAEVHCEFAKKFRIRAKKLRGEV